MTRSAARVATKERGASRLGLMAYSDPIAMVGIGLSIVVSAVGAKMLTLSMAPGAVTV